MWLAVTLFAAAFAFAPSSKSLVEARPRLPFKFPDLRVLTDMFRDCETIILSHGRAPHNIQDVIQPVKLFNDRRVFRRLTSHSKYINSHDIKTLEEQMIYYNGNKINFLRKELKGRSCRAQILVFYNSTRLRNAKSVHVLSGFRKDESTYRYTVVIHRDNYLLEKKLFIWTTAYRLTIVPHFYHVTMACRSEHKWEKLTKNSKTRILSQIGTHYKGWKTCSLTTFKTACICCKIDDVVEYPCRGSHQKLCPIEIAEDSHKHGSILANERHIAIVHYRQYVEVYALKFAIGNLKMPNSNRWFNYRDFIKSVQKEFGGHALFTRLEELIFPEEIFLHSVLTHHENMTVISWEDRPHEIAIVEGEKIIGPGLENHFFGGAVSFVPVGETGITFMTCSNITFIPHKGIFFSPFDPATWMWGLTSVITVSVTMLMAIKRMKIFPALFLTLYTMVRLLLDNHGSVNRGLVSRGRLMDSLTFLMALTTIILNTGYKGVLTSDFAKPPKTGAAPTFEQVLASNWSAFHHTSLAFPKVQNVSLLFDLEWTMQLKIEDVLEHWNDSTEMSRQNHRLVYTANALKEYQLVSIALEKLTRDQDKLNSIGNKEDMTSLLGECHCNGSYWVFEMGTFRQLGFPKACHNGSENLIFLLSEELIAKSSVTWTNTDMRPGPLFMSIHRAIEAGLHHWLNKVRGSSIFGVYVQDHVMTRQLKKEPKALSMKTLLVSSTFHLYGVLSLLTVGVLVGELLWARKKRIYFALHGCAKPRWDRIKKGIIKCYEACKEEDP